MNIFKKWFPQEPRGKILKESIDFNQLLERGALLVDVRTSSEKMQSLHIPGSVNIPLSQLKNQINTFKSAIRPIIFYCKSGKRSSKAVLQMRKMGIECYHGGDMSSLHAKLNRLQYGPIQRKDYLKIKTSNAITAHTLVEPKEVLQPPKENIPS